MDRGLPSENWGSRECRDDRLEDQQVSSFDEIDPPCSPDLILDQKPPLQHVLDQQPQPSHRRAAAPPAHAAAPPPPLHMDQQRSPSCCHPTTLLRQAEACLELPTTVKQPLLQRPPSCLHPPSLHSATKLVSCVEKYLGIEGDSKVLNQVDLRLNEKKLVDEEVRAIEVDKIDEDDGLHDSSKIATFDFDGCLAKTSMKGVNADTWSLVSPSIPEKLHNRYKDELHDARKDMVNGLKDMSIYSRMGVKTMGELDNKPFHVTIMRKFIEDVYIEYAIVEEYSGLRIQPHKAIVGANAFALESGIHQDGMLKHKNTYEIISPEDIGLLRYNESGIVLGKLSLCDNSK
ncbi:hypothetical protein SASPL_145655 [Salvia splendens]|uniref:2-isopropylmalate synthase/homocitrate synthase post-catalytic domain-containing protein n=1 Tax=Salvia splendens TaxID=180675 RepID=A0A8X8WJA2_SALSN|nr:hypothetical protein SASPL_145655 [Salvia splendens]